MNKNIIFCLLLMTGVFAICSCNNNKNDDFKNKKLLTERIQYDVFIKSPDPDFDWWNQNIEGSKREPFIKTILDLAYSGKVKAYDYYNNPLTPEQVKKIGYKNDTISTVDPNDPTKMHDTVIKTTLNLQQITKVRFLEEWYLDEKNFSFDKKVVGMMLMQENYDDSLHLRGYSPICWIYFDKSYPAKLK